MTKRTPKSGKSNLDLDDELSRKIPRPLGLSVKKDNWKVSSDKAKEDTNWNSTKKLLGLGAFNVPGYWDYRKDKNERYWVVKASHTGAPREAGLSPEKAPGGPFRANEGDREISYIYRDFWLSGDASTFIHTIYQQYAIDGIVPEVEVWKIWRCLVGELVPVEDAWDSAPPHILTNPDTIWQTGKCIFQILTRGRFFDNQLNILRLVDNDEKFGAFKVAVLHETYSQSLLKCVLSCFAYQNSSRPTREMLTTHFEDVLAIFAHGPTEKSEEDAEPTPSDEPYHPTNNKIPNNLTKASGSVYKTILQTVEDRRRKGEVAPRIVVVTDLAKDFDDLLAMIALKELHRLGAIQLEGFVANLYPAEERALLGRGALDNLGLPGIPIAVGSAGEKSSAHRVLSYEFDGSETFTAPKGSCLESGEALLRKIFTRAREGNYKITLLTLSSLMDIAEFAEQEPELLKATLRNVVLQGGYNMINGKLEADLLAQNNGFSPEHAVSFHKFMQDNKIPSTCFTKVATFATPIYQTFLEELETTGVKVGVYLRKVQLGQDLHFWKCASGPKEGRFRAFMDEPWFLSIKTTWYDKHEFDEPGPRGVDITPWLDKVTAYDCLAAIGSSGEDILNALGILKPLTTRPDADDPIHKIVGVLSVQNPVDRTKNLPEDANIHGDTFAVVIKALVLGSLLSVVQKIPSDP